MKTDYFKSKTAIFCIFMFVIVSFVFFKCKSPNIIKQEIIVSNVNHSIPFNGFISGAPYYEIVNILGHTNVIKINGAYCKGDVITFPLTAYKDRLITIEFTADVRREGATGGLYWGLNNHNYPSLVYLENAATGIWHKMKGRMIITPTDNNPYFFLSAYQNNSQNTVYYISNLSINIIEGDTRTPDFSLKLLKEIYSEYFLIGNTTGIYGENMYGKSLDLIKHHFNIITCNVFYPQLLAPINKGEAFQFTNADKIINILRRENFEIYGHLLVWHSLTPAWMFEGSRDEVLQNMNNHIITVMRHYRGRVNSWEVVAEAIKTTVNATEVRGDWRNNVRKSEPGIPNLWYEKLGADYIEIAFRTARATDPNAILYYSDYIIHNDINKAEVIRKMIFDINERYKIETSGTRNLIEGVGLQSHFGEFNVDLRIERSNLEKFASLGIDVFISELDIASTRYRVGSGLNSVMSEREQIIQGRLYAQLLQLYKEYSDYITRVTFFGLDDQTSWRSDGNPTLFDSNLNAKQAFYAVSDPEGFLRRNRI